MSEDECAEEIDSTTRLSPVPCPVSEIVHTLTPFLAHVATWLVLKGGDGVILVIEARSGDRTRVSEWLLAV
jgi:hypothetical protein